MDPGAAPNIASKTILVVANETLGGKELLDVVRERADEDTRFILCVPQNKPRAGLVIYDDAVFDAGRMAAAERADPRVREWEALMWQFQQPTPWTPGATKWTPMQSIFQLSQAR